MPMDTCCTVRSLISLTNYARPACLVSLLPSSLQRSPPGDANVLVFGLPGRFHAPRGWAGGKEGARMLEVILIGLGLLSGASVGLVLRRRQRQAAQCAGQA